MYACISPSSVDAYRSQGSQFNPSHQPAYPVCCAGGCIIAHRAVGGPLGQAKGVVSCGVGDEDGVPGHHALATLEDHDGACHVEVTSGDERTVILGEH